MDQVVSMESQPSCYNVESATEIQMNTMMCSPTEMSYIGYDSMSYGIP